MNKTRNKDVLLNGLHKFLSKLIAKDEIILQLQNPFTELESRVLETKKFSSKDCLIIENMPDVDGNLPIATKVCAFFDLYLNSKTYETLFEACHYLSSPRIGRKWPAIIVKFVYFGKNRSFMDVTLDWPRKKRKKWPPNIHQRQVTKNAKRAENVCRTRGLDNNNPKLLYQSLPDECGRTISKCGCEIKKTKHDIKEKAVKEQPKGM